MNRALRILALAMATGCGGPGVQQPPFEAGSPVEPSTAGTDAGARPASKPNEESSMSTREMLIESVGQWSGSNKVWLSPDAPARESDVTASIELAAGDGFAVITYDWEDDGKPQDGMLLIRIAPDASPPDMVWIDSWHTGGKFMDFRGEEHPDGRLSARGSYQAPPGPDWGWRIAISTGEDGTLRILMDNITPDGEEAPAVEWLFTRSNDG
jgi:hypothetical protein